MFHHRMLAPHDHVIKLADGRALGYAEVGDPRGYPVINNHGGLFCRLEALAAADAAERQGVRLISPDRPGLGLSDGKPGRDTLDWADDVRQLADQLDLEHFAVMGWSMGGQYALACAYAMPERVTLATIISGALPLDDPERLRQIVQADQRFAWLSHRFPLVARAVFKGLGVAAHMAPRQFTQYSARDLPGPDALVVLREPVENFAGVAAEALWHGDGMAEEYRAFVRPWRFRLEDIRPPVHTWEGDGDTLLPVNWAIEIAQRVKAGRTTICPGEGHFLAHNHWDEMFQEMAESGHTTCCAGA